MASNALRTVLSLSDLSEEEKMKLQANVAKAADQEHHKGFAVALKNAGLSGSLTIKDSIAKDQPIKEEVVEEIVEPEVQEEVVNSVVADEAPVETEVEKSTQVEETQPATPVITPELLQQFVQQSVENAIAPLQSELEKSQARTEELEGQLKSAKQSEDVLSGLGKLLGKTETEVKSPVSSPAFPNVNKVTSVHSDLVEGRIAEFMQIRDGSDVKIRYTAKGNPIPCYPTQDVDRYISEINSDPKNRRAFLDEMTEWGKKNGMFRGTRMVSEGERRAATTASDIPGGFLEMLSSFMRINARPGLVFWQFPTTIHRYDRGEGEVIDIPRAAYPQIATDSTQRLLSGSSTYVPIDSSNQRVKTGIVKMILNEYGRGRADAPPISIPTFVESHSMIPLMRILERDLFYDYYNWEDLVIREQWRRTSQALYNNDNQIVSTAAAVGKGGQMTRRFLSAVYTKLANDRVVPLPDGNYGLVTNPTALMQLKNDYDVHWSVETPEQIRELTNMMLSDYPAGEDIRLEGYKGLHEGFHIWSTNSFANGANGAEGVLDEAVNSGGTVTTGTMRTSYAFGGQASGRGIGGSGVQILFDEKTDFGRIDRAIWQSFEAHGPLDVDATGYNDTSDVPQETRVFKVNTSDQLID